MLAIHHNDTNLSRYSAIIQRVYVIGGRIVVAIYRHKKYYLKTGFVKIFNRYLISLQNQAKRLGRQLLIMKPGEAKKTYRLARMMHLNYCRLYSSLENVKFLSNPITKRIADDTLETFFEVEFAYRLKAFDNLPPDGNDRSYVELASQISADSLREQNAL